jgi:hypothetical protein
MDSYNNDTFLSNMKDSINYVIQNYDKFMLLLFVFGIIYFVDYITHFNTMLYAVHVPPSSPILKTTIPHIKKKGKRRRA